MINTAFINVWGKRVGAVAWSAASRLGSFEFQPSFLKHQWDVAPIKMPIDSEQKIFSFSDLKDTAFKGLPGLLADVLPDKYGNTLINAWLAKNGRPSNSLNPVEMLCYIGKRGMGALEFEPVVPKEKNTSTKIELDSLISMAQRLLSGRQDFQTNLPANEEKALLDILKIGTSAGGARAKAIIAYNPKSGEVRSGQADAPKGFAHWLLKFDGVDDDQLGTSQGYGRVDGDRRGTHATLGTVEEDDLRWHLLLWDRRNNPVFSFRRSGRSRRGLARGFPSGPGGRVNAVAAGKSLFE